MARLPPFRWWPLVALWALGLWLQAAPAHAQVPFEQAQSNVVISEDARLKFEAGVRYLQDPEGARYEEAYRTFRSAFATSPSAKILGNLGFCAMKLERDGEALEAYNAYLQKVPDIDPDERAQIVRDVQTLRHDLVELIVTANVPGVMVTDVRHPIRGQDVTNTYRPFATTKGILGVHSGRRTVRVSAPGYVEQERRDVEVFPGNRLALSFELRRPGAAPAATPATPSSGRAERSGRESRSHVVPWTMVGVGGALLVAGTVTGIVTLTQQSSLASTCPGTLCPAGFEDDRDRGKRLAHITDGLLIGGGVVAASGLLWLLIDAGSGNGKSDPPTGRTAQRTLRPAADGSCSTTGCAGTVRWAF